MTEHKSERIQQLVAEQAAEWVIRLQDPTPGERTAFADWLTASPANVAEFLNARATWEALNGTAFSHVPQVDALLGTLQSAAPAAVVAPAAFARKRMRTGVALAAGLATVAVGLGAALWIARSLDPSHAIYATKVGEQVTRALPDGSTAVLNTRTRVRLDWSEHHRDLHLEAGEALFEVAPDVARPFRVWANGSIIRAVGTRFNVHRASTRTTVTVLEGRVAIGDPGTAQESVQLAAGEEAQIESAKVTTRHLAEPARAVAWQTRRLIFEGELLQQVIDEFNRYDDQPLQIEDPSLGSKRIHGVFDARDRQSLIEFLREFENIGVEQRGDTLVLRRRTESESGPKLR